MPCPSTRTITSYRAVAMAALSPAGVRPTGLATTRTRGSAAASSSAIRSVPSVDGPTARTTSNSPPYSCPRICSTLSTRSRASLRTGMTTETGGQFSSGARSGSTSGTSSGSAFIDPRLYGRGRDPGETLRRARPARSLAGYAPAVGACEVGRQRVSPGSGSVAGGDDLRQVQHAVPRPWRRAVLAGEVLLGADPADVVRGAVAGGEDGRRDVGPECRLSGAGEVVGAERGPGPEQVPDAAGQVGREGGAPDLVVDDR